MRNNARNGVGPGSRVLAEGLWQGSLDSERFASLQNSKDLLRSTYILLRQEPDAAAPVQEAGAAILETLKKM